MNRSDLITLDEAAAMTGKSYWTLRNYLIADGERAPQKIANGRRRYFLRDEFTTWLSSRLPG